MIMFELMRKHIIAIVSAIVLLSTVVGTAYAFDTRYMKVSEYEDKTAKYQIQQLEDKLFELDFKLAEPNPEPLDKALRHRFNNRLKALQLKQSTGTL